MKNNNVNPVDINRIKSFLGVGYIIEEISLIQSSNELKRFYNINHSRIVSIDNYTQEVCEVMG